MAPRRLRLIASGLSQGAGLAGALRRAGFAVEAGPLPPSAARRLDPVPDAFVIDLSRAPSVGRDMGLFLRQVASTRRVPLVFVGGDPDTVAAIRRLLPDATYTAVSGAAPAVRRAVAHPVFDPVVPGVFAPFAGVPLPKKLGIREGTVVALVDAPDGFEARLGAFPPGARIRRGARGSADITLRFVRTRRELDGKIARLKSSAANGGLWILWPKKADRGAPDVSQVMVRKAGLAQGLVDFKISAIDATWSGLRFTLRGRRR